VVPVRLEPCALPIRLSRLEYTDLYIDTGYQRLKAALTASTERRDGVSVLPLPPGPDTRFTIPRQRRRWFTLVASVLIVIAGGTALYRIARPTPLKLPSTPLPADTRPTKTPLDGMVFIPGGRFLMGRNDRSDPEDSPAHVVTLPAFYLDRMPVTNSVFTDFRRSTNRISPSVTIVLGGDQSPVTQVTWDEAAAYCLAGGKRLPSEAEWEFAARGRDGRLYPWGEAFDAGAANTLESGIGHPEPVAIRSRNVSVYNVADMSGNVWQWCADDYRHYPGGAAAFAIPVGAKVIRSGSYQSDRLHVTAVTRNLELPSTRSPTIGFRCAK
jgi:formylglycine-generating enzyme required for sulfatase activity